MREIKFRAWDVQNKSMISSSVSIGNILNKYINDFPAPLVGTNGRTTKEDYILMQFTGLKDKNGKEIYEGDIISINDDELEPGYFGRVVPVDFTCIVIFEDGQFKFKEINSDGIYDYDDWGGGMEIIGNIHENQELREK